MLRAWVYSVVFIAAVQAAPVMAQSSAPVAGAPPQVPASPAPNPDPWERMNRRFYKIEDGLDHAVLRPAAVFYHHALARPIRQGVHNVIANLSEPITFENNVLQVRPGKAGKTAARFVLNSTVGLGGLFDVAGQSGLPHDKSGFSDTLERYGAPQGPYLFIPLMGPSSIRDATGKVVDVLLDPLTWIKFDDRTTVQITRSVADGLDQRDTYDPILKSINRTATDPYATIRSAFLQTTAVTGKTDTDVKALPDFGPEPTAPSQPAPAQPAPHPPNP